MLKGFAGASIWSEDLNNLLPFYRDILGLPLMIETPAFVVFGEGNAPALALGTHSEVAGPNMDPARHMVAIMSDDIEADVQRLKAQGVAFIQEPTKDDGITLSTCTDPEGNYVQIFQFDEQ